MWEALIMEIADEDLDFRPEVAEEWANRP